MSQTRRNWSAMIVTSSLATRGTKFPFQSKNSDPIQLIFPKPEDGISDVSYRSFNSSLANGKLAVATPDVLAQAKQLEYVKICLI